MKPNDPAADPAKKIPTMGTKPKVETVNGVKVTIYSDGRIDLPGGIRLPKGSKWSAKSKGEIRSGDGKFYYVRDGKVITREKVHGPGLTVGGDAKSGLADIHGSKYRDRVLYDPAAKPAATAPKPTSGSPTGGGRPASDHAAVSGGPFWGNPDDPTYAQQNIVTLNVDGLKFSVNEAVATQFSGFIHDLVLAGYHPKAVQGYNNRDIAGSSTKSNHAYGAAIDIDPGDNPRYGSAGGKHTIDDKIARSLAKKWGLSWGGDYKTSKDYMHFEALNAPATPGAPPGGAAPVVPPAAKAATPPTGGKTAVPAAAAATTTETAAAAGSAGPLPANATPQQIKDEVARSYGYLAAFLNDPELGPILSKAAIEDWDEARLTGALTATRWWKTHSDVTRQWDALNRLDPAKAKAQLDSQMASVRDLAQQKGVTLPGNLLHDMSVNALRFGWNSAQINDALESQGKLDPKTKAVNVQKLRELANEWMVPMSDAALDKWSQDIQFERMSADDYEQYLKEQAKSLFPNLAGAIDRGVTVKQYTDPYRQYAAQILEVSPDSIDFMHDPKFSKALFNTNAKTGEREQMSLSDWQRYLRSTPDYAKTAGAVDGAAQFTDMLTQTFGKVA